MDHLLGVLVEGRPDRNHHGLSGREPEGPLPSEVLGEDGDLALNGAQDGPGNQDGHIIKTLDCNLTLVVLSPFLFAPVDDDRPLLLALLVDVVEVEPHRELEVQLDGCALVLPAQGVRQRDVDLGPVEGAVARVQLPLQAGLGQRVAQRLLGLVPHLHIAEELLWPGAQLQAELEAEGGVDMVQEVQAAVDLFLDLLGKFKDCNLANLVNKKIDIKLQNTFSVKIRQGRVAEIFV